MVIILSQPDTISFQMLGEEYLMSYIDFFKRMGLVDMEYARIKLHSKLQVDLLVHLSPDQVWTKTLPVYQEYVYVINVCVIRM